MREAQGLPTNQKEPDMTSIHTTATTTSRSTMNDYCPTCRVTGMQPCVDADGNDTPDHPQRPTAFANDWTPEEA